MRPVLETLEDRTLPSTLGAVLPSLVGALQTDASQLSLLHKQMGIYEQLLGADIAAGYEASSIQNVYGAGTAFFGLQSYWNAGQQAIQADRLLILVGIATGQFDTSDAGAVLSAWQTINAIDAADNTAYAADLAVFNSPFPDGWLFPLPGKAGANSLATVYPGLNS